MLRAMFVFLLVCFIGSGSKYNFTYGLGMSPELVGPYTHRHTDRQTYRQTHTDRETERQTDRHTDRQTHRQADRPDR